MAYNVINVCFFIFQYNDKSVITIRRNGSATVSPLEVMQNDHIYSGIQNELILSQVYTTSFTCEYDMGAYPFDMQKCSMIFIMQVKQIKQANEVFLQCLLSYFRATVETLPSCT